MAAMGVNRFVAERALNHKIHDIEGVYDQYDYFNERRAAMTHLAALLVAISRGDAFDFNKFKHDFATKQGQGITESSFPSHAKARHRRVQQHLTNAHASELHLEPIAGCPHGLPPSRRSVESWIRDFFFMA